MNAGKRRQQNDGEPEPEKNAAGLLRNPDIEGLLTASEWRALDLQTTGLSYKEIADRLGISSSTVKNELFATRQKLKVHNIAGAIQKAYILGRRGEAD